MKRRDFLKTASAAGTAAAATTLAAPAIAKERIEMVMVSTWGRDFPGLGTGAQRLAKNLELISGGRIHVEYFAANERVKAFDSFDEVASGNAQAYHAADYYWKGKHKGYAFFGSVPFGLTVNEVNTWIDWGGGQELWDELGAPFNIKCFKAGNNGVQMGGWFRKEMNSADDFKGLKMRIPGMGGDVLAKMGASPVSLPGSQIYEALVSGAIDATEWVGPWNDGFMKFYEAAKYYYWPGFHEPGTMESFGMNKTWWEGLSKSDQKMIEAACALENNLLYSEYCWNNGSSMVKLLEEHGVLLREFSDDIFDAAGEATAEVFEEYRADSDLTARILDSMLAARQSVGSWMNTSEVPYIAQRNRVLGI